MAKEKQKPGPAAGEKPMGMTSEVTVEDRVAILTEKVEKLEEKVNDHYRYHFGGRAT